MSKEKEKLDKWLLQEQQRIKKERQDYMDTHDMKQFFRPAKGSSKIELLRKMPRTVKGSFGDREAFRIRTEDGVEWDWCVNRKSPLYRDLINRMRLNVDLKFELIRTGDGKSTRYDIA